MTFEEAVTRAVEDAPSVRASEAKVQASQSAAIAADQLPDPTINVALENYPISGPPAFSFTRESMTMERIGVAVDLDHLHRLYADFDAAVASAEADALAGWPGVGAQRCASVSV